MTEKIDGTNASIYIEQQTGGQPPLGHLAVQQIGEDSMLWMVAGSRSRWISPADDNFGFAAWARTNATELFKLGPGHHFGEWWGPGIQRGYGVREKTFSLFNVHRWGAHNPNTPACCSVVPLLGHGDWPLVDTALDFLRENGSVASPGFMRPEGIIVYHSASRSMYKVTLEKDDEPKGRAA